jgi:hypothetical protein
LVYAFKNLPGNAFGIIALEQILANAEFLALGIRAICMGLKRINKMPMTKWKQ